MQKYLVFALVLGLAWGETSIVQGENHVGKRSEGNQSAEGNQRGTEESPFVVNEHAIQSKEEAAEEARKDAEQNRVNERIIDLTFAIAICACLQFLGILGQILVYLKQTKLMKSMLEAMETQANEMALQHGEMEKQAGYMKDQTETLRDSVKAAQASADAAMAQIDMVKNKERGRLRIEFGRVDLVNDPHPDNGYEVPFNLILDGATQVFIRENSCTVAIRESDEVPANDPWWRGMGLPTTITPEDRTFKGSMTILTEDKPWGEPPFGPDVARVSLVREEKLHVFVRAIIQYDDIFGGTWEVRSNNRWAYNHAFGGLGEVDLSRGFWVSIGDNGEYQPEYYKRPPNPN